MKAFLTMGALALLMATIAPAAAGGARVTTGTFVALEGAAELGYDVTGSAVMVRIPSGEGVTRVTVHLAGLAPDTTYPVHVHNAPCSATPPGGGHYQQVVGGAVDAVNEIWPAAVTNAAGNGLGKATHGHWARPDAQSIVVHYPQDTRIRLACADLG